MPLKIACLVIKMTKIIENVETIGTVDYSDNSLALDRATKPQIRY